MNPSTLLVLGGLAWWFWPQRQRNPGRRRRNIEAFTDQHGIHPIRGSDHYDEEVVEVEQENRELDHQAERYRGVNRERETALSGGVDRPPWAVGISNAALEGFARKHGENARSPGWWERAGLYSHRKLKAGQRDRGELEDVVSSLRSGSRGRSDISPRPRAAARSRYKPPADLPW